MRKLFEGKLKKYKTKEFLFTDFRIQTKENFGSEWKICKNGHTCFVPHSFGGNRKKSLYCLECGTEIIRLSRFLVTRVEL